MDNNVKGTKKADIIAQWKSMTFMKKTYMLRFFVRCMILIVSIILYFTKKELFEVIDGMNFFNGFSLFHILWIVWIGDMIFQLFPIRGTVAIGSQKLFRMHFRPILEIINYRALKEFIIKTTKDAYKIMLLWVAFIMALGGLYFAEVIDANMLFLITIIFYVCDLICVLFWCPFRLIMKNRCCTTCRIFNWDHLMMFTPMVFLKSFYSWSLIVMAVAVWIVWEINIFLYPERFWENTNKSLQCINCTDKLCPQNCKKLQ